MLPREEEVVVVPRQSTMERQSSGHILPLECRYCHGTTHGRASAGTSSATRSEDLWAAESSGVGTEIPQYCGGDGLHAKIA